MILIATAPVSPSRSYQYDTLGRPTSRTLARQGTTRNDVFTYNDRSELISDVVDGTGLNGWDYDNIGNRLLQQQGSACDTYTSNQLNQYTAIEDESHDVFTPTYDDDGNQTRIKTSTGIWDVTYNAKNRPVLFSKEGENLTVACTYDYMGRRATKVVTENGVVTTSHRFLYRGYLQVACCDRKRSTHPCLWLITWDPTQPIATRPLAIQKDGTWYTYGWDLTKNVWEVYGTTGYIGTAYTYTAYGQVTVNGAVSQPIQWSSEYNEDELGVVYYNYRHYNPIDGFCFSRDPLVIKGITNPYLILFNSPIYSFDYAGCNSSPLESGFSISKEASVPPWILDITSSFGIFGIKAGLNVSLTYNELCCVNKEQGFQIASSGSYHASVEVGTPGISKLGVKFRMGWYGNTSAEGTIKFDYSSCVDKILPNISASIKIELGLIMQLSDKKEEVASIGGRGGFGIIFAAHINNISRNGFDIGLEMSLYATISVGFSVGPFSLSQGGNHSIEKQKLLEIPVRF